MTSQKKFQQLDKTFEQEHDKLIEDDYEVAKKKINWDNIPEQYITKEEILSLKQLEGNGDELLAPDGDITALFEENDEASNIAKAFISILDIRSNDQLKYILTLLSHILSDNPIRGQIFLNLAKNNNDNNNNKEEKIDNEDELKNAKTILDKFKTVWLRDDLSNFVRGKSAICCGNILRWGNKYCINDYKSLSNYLFREFQTNQTKGDNLLPTLYALKAILNNSYFQHIFINEDGINRLSKILENNKQHHQVVYLVSYCLWIISFKKEFKNVLVNEILVKKLCKIVKIKLSTKAIRVVLALFENLLNVGEFNEMVVQNDLYETLMQFSDDEKITDDELKKSVKNLLESLEKSVKILSSFETYVQEIKYKNLKKGPCHTPVFFKKYSYNFEKDDFKLIKDVINLLDSDDSDVVAIACYDIGQWAKYYVDARFVLNKLNGKFKLMSLIEHNDKKVRKEALIAVQSVLIKQSYNIDNNDEKKENKV